MRIQMLLLPTAAFQIVSTNLFVVTGRPKISIFLSLLRQCIVLIPCILIFGRVWGLWGVVAAAPVSDACALFITGTMIFFELRKLHSAGAKVSA
jgi:Na+-driven multidrug efflux pump